MIYYVFNYKPAKIENCGSGVTLLYPMDDPYLRRHPIIKDISNLVGQRFSIKGVRMILISVSLNYYSSFTDSPMMWLCMVKETAPKIQLKEVQIFGSHIKHDYS